MSTNQRTASFFHNLSTIGVLKIPFQIIIIPTAYSLIKFQHSKTVNIKINELKDTHIIISFQLTSLLSN